MEQRENLPVGFSQRSSFSAQKIGKGEKVKSFLIKTVREWAQLYVGVLYSTSKKADRFSAKVAVAVDFLRHKY